MHVGLEAGVVCRLELGLSRTQDRTRDSQAILRDVTRVVLYYRALAQRTTVVVSFGPRTGAQPWLLQKFPAGAIDLSPKFVG